MYNLERETGLEPATACLEGRVSHDRRSLPRKWLHKRLCENRLQCERARQKLSRAFFPPFGKTRHVILPLILAKNVARNSEQAVTLPYTLYLLSSLLAMFSRKEVLTTDVDASLEFGSAR